MIATRARLFFQLKDERKKKNETRFTAEALEVSTSQCHSCKHWKKGTLTCKAYPDGIPVGFFTGEYDHTKTYPGDHGILYEPME